MLEIFRKTTKKYFAINITQNMLSRNFEQFQKCGIKQLLS